MDAERGQGDPGPYPVRESCLSALRPRWDRDNVGDVVRIANTSVALYDLHHAVGAHNDAAPERMARYGGHRWAGPRQSRHRWAAPWRGGRCREAVGIGDAADAQQCPCHGARDDYLLGCTHDALPFFAPGQVFCRCEQVYAVLCFAGLSTMERLWKHAGGYNPSQRKQMARYG